MGCSSRSPFNRAALGVDTAEDVTVGIRPEAFRAGAAEFTLEAVAEVTELTGPELILTGKFDNGDKVSASLPPQSRIYPGAIVPLGIKLNDVHLFDSVSGSRLN